MSGFLTARVIRIDEQRLIIRQVHHLLLWGITRTHQECVVTRRLTIFDLSDGNRRPLDFPKKFVQDFLGFSAWSNLVLVKSFRSDGFEICLDQMPGLLQFQPPRG